MFNKIENKMKAKNTKTTKRITLFEMNYLTYWIEELIFPNNFKPNRIFQVEGFGLFKTMTEAKQAIEESKLLS